MADIDVRERNDVFHVTVREGRTETLHRVTVPDAFYRSLTEGKISKAECVSVSFRFLLERESKESILSRFDLPVISTYFPNFEREFKDYLQR